MYCSNHLNSLVVIIYFLLSINRFTGRPVPLNDNLAIVGSTPLEPLDLLVATRTSSKV
jgi:hypothetical protein